MSRLRPEPRGPLALTQAEVAGLLEPAAARTLVAETLLRLGAVPERANLESPPAIRLELGEGAFAVAASLDSDAAAAGLTVALPAAANASTAFLFSLEPGELAAVLQADPLRRLARGAASALAAQALARPEAATLGVIGLGALAAMQIACLREALPGLARVLVAARPPRELAAFCAANDAEPAESDQEAAAQDVVVTASGSRDPVLRGDWLAEGALVCATGADDPRSRELDNAVLERASFVCCSSRAAAALQVGDLIEPVGQGVLDWLEVHELHELLGGEVQGRASPADIVVFTSNSVAAVEAALAGHALALARARGLGTELWSPGG